MVQLDAYISILMAVIEFKLTPPIMHYDSSKPVKIVKSRNLLVEYQRQNKYVKQDYNIAKSTTTIVCGSNGSGKSIYLRTFGDIVYLA